jgi:hypothetical protein
MIMSLLLIFRREWLRLERCEICGGVLRGILMKRVSRLLLGSCRLNWGAGKKYGVTIISVSTNLGK